MYTVKINGIECKDIVTVSENGTQALCEITDLIGAGVIGNKLPTYLNINGRTFSYTGNNDDENNDGEVTVEFYYQDGAGKKLTIVND